MIKYKRARDIDRKVRDIVLKLEMHHIDLSRLVCIRSFGSKSRYVIARCHSLPKIFQKALSMQAFYIIEVISERFDRLSEEEKTKTLIHELLHIPKSFAGGFRHHRPYVNKKTVNEMYRRYVSSI
ncbi:MAG: metallopeptidase [Spirochaetes bacterium]|nr:MAG: metallopeptidase [Spirochaetota bacterium]